MKRLYTEPYTDFSHVFCVQNPCIGDTPINEVTAPKALTALRAIEARGMNETAHTVHRFVPLDDGLTSWMAVL
jgi:hypothetical protein